MRAWRAAGFVALVGIVAAAAGPREPFAAQTTAAAVAAADTVDASVLIGTWRVDLRPSPDAEPYYQEFTVTEVSGDAFTATFYGTPVSEARLNLDWGAVRFAFVTEDGSGPYYHSGVLLGDRLEGTTHSSGRGFLAYWTAERASAGD